MSVKKMNKPAIKEVLIAMISVFVLNQVGLSFGFYLKGGEYDSIVHFMGGVSVAFGILWIYFYTDIFKPKSRSYKNFFFVSLSAVIFIGFTWELYELFIDVMSVDALGYNYDTTLDIIFDTLGAVLATIYTFNQERQYSPISKPAVTSSAESIHGIKGLGFVPVKNEVIQN